MLRTFALMVLLFGLGTSVRAQEVIVYKSPTCGCCSKWVEYLQAEGFTVKARDMIDMRSIKQRFGVPGSYASCHTAVVEGRVIEGHVPASAIRKLLADKQAKDIRILTAPGMPVGSPGMEVPGRKPQVYTVWAIDKKGNVRPFARYQGVEEKQ